LNISDESRLDVRTSMWRRHVFSSQDLGRACLSANRGEPPRGRSSPSAGDRDAGALRGFAGQWPIGAVGALGGAVCGQGHDAERGKLARQLAKGDKALVGNTGYRRYLKTISQDHFAIDPDKVEEEKKFDGIFVLRTNTDLNPLEAMLCYKQLWTVEQTFRTAKHLFSTRPIFHKLDETIRGHVFCSFLALVLKKALEDRIAAFGRSSSWPEIIADLDSLS
jgi:hypothetical protein